MNIFQKDTKVLLISPHPDDIEFGCASTIYHNRKNIKTKLVVLSTRLKTRGETNNQKQQEKSAKLLRIQDVHFEDFPIRFFGSVENRDKIRLLFTKICSDFKPDIILLPAINETMQDHSALTEEITRIIKNSTILGYEVIKHNRYFKPNVFVKISKKDLDIKIKAIMCFQEQKKKFYFNNKIIESLAIVRAANNGFSGYAEAFELYNLALD